MPLVPPIFTYFPLQPTIHEVGKLEDLNTSSEFWFSHVIKNTRDGPDLSKPVGSYVDARDVALANVLAVETETAGDERILVSTCRPSSHRAFDSSLNSLPSSIHLAGYE